MIIGDILEAVTEPNFIVEVMDLEEGFKEKGLTLETFVGKVIQFPEKSNRWANKQTVGYTGRYLKRDFMPSIVATRDAKLASLLDCK
jgi:hypothetical protein